MSSSQRKELTRYEQHLHVLHGKEIDIPPPDG
jgi:hypothetical protein